MITNNARTFFLAALAIFLFAPTHGEAPAQTPTPSSALLVLEKDTNQLDIIDPATLKIVAKAPVGQDPHEVIASADGKLAYISNYGGGEQSSLHIISVVDLVAQKALPPIDLGALRGTHGLDFAGGELYFTAEANKVIGRYDPVTQKVDWVMGTGQDRTHMVWVAPTLDKIVTTNVSSATISIMEMSTSVNGGFGPPPGAQGGNRGGGGRGPGGPPPGGNQKTWEVTSIPVGHGSEGFDVSSDGKEIWVANAQDATLSIVDFASKKVIQTVPVSVGGANRLKFTLDGKYVLVSGLGMGGRGPAAAAAASAPDLVVLDAATRREVKKLNLGGGSAGIQMDPNGPRAFVASSGGNKVLVIDLTGLIVTGQIAPLGQPDGMAWAVRK